VGEKDRNRPGGVFAVAAFAADGRIGVPDRAQGIEAGFAVHANVFVKRHNNILNPESYQVNGRLYSFEGYFNNVEGWKVGSVEGWKNGRMEGWKPGRLEHGRSQDVGKRAYVLPQFRLFVPGLGRIGEKPVDVAAIVTNQAIGRYVCPVEFEEGGQGSV
jgi:hypothetical protein